MRAIAVSALRADPVLVELPKPEPRPGEVRVRVEYASLNPLDWQVTDGSAGGLAPTPRAFPFVVGLDYAGRVDMIGGGENRFRVGDPVFGRAAVAEACGSYGEYLCVEQDSAIALVPRGLTPRAAAALPSAGMAAAQILEEVALRGHETLLVVGAAGGVGCCLTQLARARDVRVIAAVRGDERSRMGSLGAAASVDLTDGPPADALRRACPDGIDALADLASADPDAFAAYAAAVRPGGIALSTRGAAAGARLPEGVRGVDFRLDPSPVLLDVLAAGAADGILRVPVDAEVPLAQAPPALARNRAGGARGKTVIVVHASGHR
ncbi:NADP-dependent oxidoreductase [Streptomyces sp. NBC_00441]|uniref:NADP-dependent oxidoreductase n=1 Tax=Streptomyces sp. NBC_00441 TaxID=2975742 RepID=UPI002E2B172D|nr:NADP-dependent oxidoreductase [Streptomyces sp. NBC_00441]